MNKKDCEKQLRKYDSKDPKTKQQCAGRGSVRVPASGGDVLADNDLGGLKELMTTPSVLEGGYTTVDGDPCNGNGREMKGARVKLVVNNKPCPTCRGEGWMMDDEGQPCPDCQHPEYLGGTGYIQSKKEAGE